MLSVPGFALLGVSGEVGSVGFVPPCSVTCDPPVRLSGGAWTAPRDKGSLREKTVTSGCSENTL